MKKMKKFFALLIAMVMVLGMSTMVFAASDGSIEVTSTHKNQEYELYQLFDATTIAGRTDGGTGISYKLMEGKTDFKVTVGDTVLDGATWFKLDEGGNVVIKDASAAASITEDNADFAAWAKAYGVKTGNTITPTDDGGEVKWSALPEGYYFITTTTGSLVTIDSIKPNETVRDKNPDTSVDKSITGVPDGSVLDTKNEALAQIGKVVSYESRIPISRGAYNYSFTDTMSAGLTLDPTSVKVYVVETGAAVAPGATDVNSACGTVNAANQTDETKADITITFSDSWLKTNWEKDIVIQYSATVNKDAVVADAGNPNTAKISYGNEDNPLTNEETVKVYTAKISVVKQDGDNEPLAGAGFKLKNSEGKYYKLVDGIVTWVTESEAVEADPDTGIEAQDAVVGDEHFSDPEGNVPAFTGLANGTYTLVESTVPAGYNQAADETITIAEKDVTAGNLSQSRTVINQSGTELPSTGGIGTTIFYIIGAILVIGAGVVLVTRRRMNVQ